MKIKKLELFGFKSFVDKTVLKFDHDVLGIVGPNGCGKSNIVDAIRWCMGEQSAKHLRGRSMEDVLFNGSESRGPSEYAEVTLTFENNDPSELPLEFQSYAEIAVTRRLHRSGESEYLVNKEAVRLKDITDLFLGTGVGTKAYSIVEQGKIGLIVSAKPEDRRMLIEEAAGITKFKSRKKLAERKMEQTEQNLLRVGDIVAEIDRNLGTLKRQAAKAERYVSYRSELEELQLYEATHRYLEHSGWVRRESTEIARVSAESDEMRTRLERDEAEFEALRAAGTEVEDRLEQATSGHFAAENAVRGEEAAMARAIDRKTTIVAREITAMQERDALVSERDAILIESDELRAQLAFLESDGNGASERLQTEAARLLELQANLSAAQRHGDQLRVSAAQANTEIATSHAKLESFQSRRAEMEDRVARLDFEATELGERKSDLEGRLARLDAELEDLRAAKLGAAEELATADAALSRLRGALLGSERQVESARAEAQKHRSRLGALQELSKRLDGVGAGAKALLAGGDPALRGLVAEFVEAPAELTTALAAVLGSRLEHVVVRDVDRGIELLTALGESGAGRAALIPEYLSFVAGGRPLPDEPGLLGRLVDKVHYAPEHEGLVRSLLGDAVLVDGADAARRIRDAHRITTVTHSGLVFDAEGSIRGGSGESMAEGMLDTKREIRELELAVGVHDEAVAVALAAHAALRGELESVQSSLEFARKIAHDAELSCLAVDKDRSGFAAEIAQLHKRIEHGAQERTLVQARLEEADLERQTLDARAEAARETVERAAVELLDAEVEIEKWRGEVEAQRKIETEHRVLAASANERLGSVRGALHRLDRSTSELATRSKRLDAELAELAEQIGVTFGSLFVIAERLQIGREQSALATAALADAKSDFEAHRSARDEREHFLREVRKHAGELREQLARHEMLCKEHEIALTHLEAGVAERFRGLELRTVIHDHHMKVAPGDDVRARIVALSHLLERMGSVNLEAMKEHTEAEERFAYYSTQKGDLDQALVDLRKAIDQMNKESKRLFKETFDAVNEKFQTIFPKMFRGGRASLRLTNPDDMLETGIDILAQPPGKKISSIELMSGGEKALTAVSLIFAIFQIKPSPFCILDEVDAPLDEANVARYNEMIREMTDRSQFILITHIKRTMQLVDVLYGVTMQESGVSRLVSVKMQGASERKADGPTKAPLEQAVA